MMQGLNGEPAKIAVIIPCYKVKAHVLSVIDAVGTEVDRIYCVDDACPDGSGQFILENNTDPRVRVIFNPENRGVGGAVIRGYQQAVEDRMDVVVKIDGDGQMDPILLPAFVSPIINGNADYTKGNRFWDMKQIRQMPLLRRIGNLGLSFMSKASTGYWDVFDPTNGYTAIHSEVARRLPLEDISQRYFFETDMLFRLNTMRASVVDIPMDAKYGDEESNLKIGQVLGEFSRKHGVNFFKRILYNYFLRDFSAASFELVLGLGLAGFGVIFGLWKWKLTVMTGTAAPVGTIMIATVALVTGLQFLLSFINFDVAAVPRRAIYPSFTPARRLT